ncbi:MAG: hypothetical protein ACSLFH_09140 [Desulfuromonadales bacterium]
MSDTASTQGSGNSLLRNVSLFALVAAGLACNYFHFPIFMNVDFLFGSIFALLALQLFGLARGIIVAALIASYTYFLWNHPYSIVIMTAEVVVVGWVMSRTKTALVMADTLYWLIVGLPLVFLFYHIVMQSSLSNTYIIMSKQAVNGIANALVARLIYTGFRLRTRTALMSYREIIYNLLVLFVLCPTLILLAISSRSDFAKTDKSIQTGLTQEIQHLSLLMNTWLKNRTSLIVTLAELAAILPPEQMQDRLDQARAADGNFLRIGMRSKESVVMAYTPKIDDFGKSNVGKKFPERPYIPTLRATLKPMLGEVVMARIIDPKPAAVLLTPILINGEFSGYINGVLDLNQIGTIFSKAAAQTVYLYTVLDQKGNVITTNRTDQTVMEPFERGQGELTRLDGFVSQWRPTLAANDPAIERWENAIYIGEMAIGSQAEWTLILEQPVALFRKCFITIMLENCSSCFCCCWWP